MELLITEPEHIVQKCCSCKRCQIECAFLKRNGTPKEIADAFISNKIDGDIAFECNLCRLCNAVCPDKLNPADMFLEVRQKWQESHRKPLKKHRGVLAYERLGHSKWFTWYGLPENCDTILFPGCTLPGTHPDIILKLFGMFQKKIPSIGVVLDCCMKPSHDLGKTPFFNEMFQEMLSFLLENGIKHVLTACPNCFKVFQMYGKGLSVRTVYEFLSEIELPQKPETNQTVTVHDSCVMRFEKKALDSIRHLVSRQGIRIREMPHSKEVTLCCGEGGSASLISPDLTEKWPLLRKKEADDNTVITYCAGCTEHLGRHMPAIHILDLLFASETSIRRGIKGARPPFAYLNRLRLKHHLKHTLKSNTSPESALPSKAANLKKYIVLLVIITGILFIHFSNIHHLLDQETMREFIAEYGILGPLIYMLVYTIAPTFLLPGLPITIAGGILFGPFWGVVYTITGATAGACMPFLISRYTAREWITLKIKASKYHALDLAVERNGWKAVAFTRLIPVFPYNILNYAFGLTKISFSHYLVTTFICMLPGCISYVVFSSSILGVLKGNISIHFLIGIVLVMLVSLIPFFHKRYKGDRKNDDI